MLYISRIIDQVNYGVVDTDDGKESFVDMRELKEAVLTHNLHIEGVEIHRNGFELVVTPWQPPETCTRLQTKLKVLKGIDVRTYGNYISAIVVDSRVCNEQAVIRLSDFCKFFNINVRVSWPYGPNYYKLLIVIDPVVEVDPTIIKPLPRNTMYDIKELPDCEVVESFYRAILNDEYIRLNQIGEYLIDNYERQMFWTFVIAFNRSKLIPREIWRWMEKSPQKVDYGQIIFDMNHFHFAWLKACRYKIELLFRPESGTMNSRIKMLLNHPASGHFDPENDFQFLIDRQHSIFNMLRKAHPDGVMNVSMFDNFLTMWANDFPDARRLYAEICNNLVKCLRANKTVQQLLK